MTDDDKKKQNIRRAARGRVGAAGAFAQRVVANAALARGLDGKKKAVLEVKLPSFAGIAVVVPASAPITEADIKARTDQLLHRSAEAEPVPLGARVERGDQVELDMFGYHDGDLFLTMTRNWMIVEPSSEVPGLFENIAGMLVGEEKVHEVTLSDSYPDEDVSGDPAAILVKVHQALRPQLPTLERLREQLGVKTDEELREGVKSALGHERAEALVAEAHELILDEVYMRAGISVPDTLLDDALNQMWRQQEGDALAQRNVNLGDQNAARERYLAQGDLREEMRRRFFERALLDAIIADKTISDERTGLLEQLIGSVKGTEVSANKVHEMMTGKDAWADALSSQLQDVRAMEWMFSQVKVSFAAPDGRVVEHVVDHVVAPKAE